MKLNPIICAVLIASQVSLSLAQTAFAQTQPTPEFNLLRNVIALEGEQLPQDELQTAIKGALTDYVAQANPQGQEQRLQDALVELGVMNRAQASEFTVANIPAIAQSHVAGAEFSSCDLIPLTIFGSGGIGIAIELAGGSSGPSNTVAAGFGYVALTALAIGALSILGGVC